MKFGELIAIILISTGSAILILSAAQFFLNNFEIIESPIEEPLTMGYYTSQETSEGEGEQLADSPYFLRDSQQGIELYWKRNDKEIRYFVYNDTETPMCVYAEVIAKENVDSAIFFNIPLLPGVDRDFGIIRLIPDKEAFYVVNWHVSRDPRMCRGEVQA